MKEIKVYIRALYIVFLFVKTENNNFIKEIKYVLRAFIAWWKTGQSLWEFSSSWKPSTALRVFTDLYWNSPKRSPWFSPGCKGMENMSYFLIKRENSRERQSPNFVLVAIHVPQTVGKAHLNKLTWTSVSPILNIS